MRHTTGNTYKTLGLRAWRAVDAAVAAGAKAYDRSRLARLIPLEPGDLTGPEPRTTRKIILKLARALRGERSRGRAGHWAYDLNRHIGLAQAYRAERERLECFPILREGKTVPDFRHAAVHSNDANSASHEAAAPADAGT